MTECCYKTHREDPQSFKKIVYVSTFPIVPWEYERNIQSTSQYAARVLIQFTKKCKCNRKILLFFALTVLSYSIK